MNSLVAIFFTWSLSLVQAATLPSPTAEIWSLGNEYFPIEKDAQSQRLISTDCKTTKCQAYKALSDRRKKILTENELQGGKNPGAVICKKYFKANVIILRDTKKNENAFCQFPDGSLVSASALH
jgi:hypothetical protein